MNDDEIAQVGGLKLPVDLVAAIRDGRWVAPGDHDLLATVFTDRPVQPNFYGIDEIFGETTHWHAENDAETLAWYLGSPSNTDPPGDIDQQRSVIIGDLGPDRPIALDYRPGLDVPSVVYLTSYNGWIEVAPNIESLLVRLRL